jgi:hypothetical protein
MTHLKQHLFNSADVCISCGADVQETELPCDCPLQSAPDYFDRDDPRWQVEESANTLRSAPLSHNRRNYAGRSR